MIFDRNHFFAILVLVLLNRHSCIGSLSRNCEVTVAPLWEKTTFVPQGSSVHINCTAAEVGQTPIWSIRIGSKVNFVMFPISLLNRHGFYELSQDNSEGIKLTINNTNGNNGTSIRCIDEQSAATIYETALYVYVPTPITYFSQVIAKESVNISWSPLSEVANDTYFIVRITDGNNYKKSFQLQEPYYIFTAPEGASPCEVYNFSVTEHYVGATYTGASCSAPTTVLSRMLPSLPNITSLESSLDYSLEKNSSGGVALKVTFMPADYCEMYPVTDYILEVEGSILHSTIMQPPSNNALAVNNLLDNQVYILRVVVSNSVGNVSTDNITIYTSDVQAVRALPNKHNNSFMLQCTFLAGSKAQGCVVVLVSQFGNETLNLTRSCTHAAEIVNATYSLSFYTEVYGFDIESNGLVGTLAIPGMITSDSAIIAPCVSEEFKPSPRQNFPSWIIIIIGVILGVAVVLIMTILVFIIGHCLFRRFRTHKDSSYCDVYRLSPTSSAGPAPDIPSPAPSKYFTDGEDTKKAPQPTNDLPERIAAHKEEHIYHVLETSAPHNVESPAHSESDSFPCDLPPIYQDIADIPLIRDGCNGRVGTSGQETSSPPAESDSKASELPVYHEIAELPSSRASSRQYDNVPSAGTNI